MNVKNVSFAANIGMILLLLAACSAFNPTAVPPQPTQTTEALPITGLQYHFVTNKLILPTTQAQAQEFGLNVDADSQNKPDNKFGELLALLTSASQSLELQTTLDQAINSGQLVSLHLVQANDPLNATNVAWSIFLGQSTQSAPSFNGSDTFTLDAAAPVNLPIIGTLVNGHFAGGPGSVHLEMVLLGQKVDVDLIGVHLEADLSEKGCSNGRLGGGVTVEEYRGNLLPAIAEGFNQIIKTDQSAAKTLLPVFDSDNNGIITSQELEGNPFLMIAISPDLDLLDASGNFNPGQDGVKDSYSIGLGFGCVPAAFTTP